MTVDGFCDEEHFILISELWAVCDRRWILSWRTDIYFRMTQIILIFGTSEWLMWQKPFALSIRPFVFLEFCQSAGCQERPNQKLLFGLEQPQPSAPLTGGLCRLILIFLALSASLWLLLCKKAHCSPADFLTLPVPNPHHTLTTGLTAALHPILSALMMNGEMLQKVPETGGLRIGSF